MTPPSDLELARSVCPGASDEDLVRGLARQLIKDSGVEAPVDLRMLASMRGIATIDLADQPWAGCLVREADRFVIRVRQGDSPQRRRFTVGHEIGHTFMPGFALVPQYRCDPLPQGPRKPSTEVLCDIAASELLMPMASAQAAIAALGVTVDAGLDLSEVCETSIEAAARRVVDLSDRPAALLSLEVMTALRDPDAPPVLRVKYAYTAAGWPTFIPPHKSAAAHSPLQDALMGEIVDTVTNLHDLCRDQRPVRLTAQIFPWCDSHGERHDRVLAIATHL